MKETRILMDMPVTVDVVDENVTARDIDHIYNYFKYIDDKFSIFKPTSEISALNQGHLKVNDASADMKTVLALCEQTKQETGGYFDITHNGQLDPSGLVKGWAIFKATQILKDRGFHNFYVEAGGDIEVAGRNNDGQKWSVGIKNPFDQTQIVKVVELTNQGIATSGSYERGQHIYNPVDKFSQKFSSEQSERPRNVLKDNVVSLTVVGPNIYEADRFATAAFAMGKQGINFIENQPGLEGYMISKNGIATYTSNFSKYIRIN